jgi:hypothetical protein
VPESFLEHLLAFAAQTDAVERAVAMRRGFWAFVGRAKALGDIQADADKLKDLNH